MDRHKTIGLNWNLAFFQESRKRKKRRLEELQRSVLFLTHENHQLREQNELLRQMLVGRLPGQQSAGQVTTMSLTGMHAKIVSPQTDTYTPTHINVGTKRHTGGHATTGAGPKPS